MDKPPRLKSQIFEYLHPDLDDNKGSNISQYSDTPQNLESGFHIICRDSIDVYESLLNIEEFKGNWRKQNHPGFQRWRNCKRFLLNHSSESLLRKLSTAFEYFDLYMDSYWLTLCSEGK
jgi:hypothetical protein